MKTRTHLTYIACLLALSSCSGGGSASNEISNNTSAFEQSLNNLRTGFTIIGNRYQIVKSLDGNELFRNTYTYDYSFENSEADIGTHQKYGYSYQGEPYSLEFTYYRDSDGYVSQKYVNYKNEIDYSRITDSDGYYAFYDQLFINPFLLVDEGDFTKLENSSGDLTSYSLAADKLAIFDYHLTGGNYPLTEMIFNFNSDNALVSISSKSITYEGQTRDSTTQLYVKITYSYESSLEVSKIGERIASSVAISTGSENEILKDSFSRITDNYTLTTYCREVSTGSLLIEEKTSYFDGNSYYIEWSKDDLTENYYYAHDPFNKNDYLYEYRYDETTKLWKQSSKDESTSYNVIPQTKEYFTPHLQEVSTSLFSSERDEDGNYTVTNEYALAYIGAGMFSDAEVLSYFVQGYCYDLKVQTHANSIDVIVSFILPISSSQYYQLEYVANYTNVGSTVVPELDI